MKLLTGKVVIITGGTRGIGKGIVENFIKNGADVAFTYASSSEVALEVENKYKTKSKIKSYKSDASSFDQAHDLVKNILKDFGKIDCVVNNAGITKDNLLMRMNEEDFQKVINANLNSVFNMTKAILKPFLSQKSGSIINMSSVVGIKGNAGQANYAASKAGIVGLSKSVALELGSRNIRSNVIAPGFIETEMTKAVDPKKVEEWRNSIPMKRGGTPDDIANACLFLASDLSTYITGQVLHVNGGMYT